MSTRACSERGAAFGWRRVRSKARDPRFDSLCGTLDERGFDSAYGFLSGYKQQVGVVHSSMTTSSRSVSPKAPDRIVCFIACCCFVDIVG